MLSFALSAFSQETVVVNSYEELKAALGKRTAARAGAARSSAVNVTTPDDLTDVFGSAKLGADIELSEVFTIGADYELTLDLNGHKITPKQGTNYHIINLGSFTIMDESGAKTGAVNCAIQNGNTGNDYAYLEIQGGTVNGNIADGAAVTNYGECIISGGKFFSEYIGLTNYNKMEIDGGNASNVYIEGKTYSIKNSAALSVENVVIAGTEESYLPEGDVHTESFVNVTYYNVALNGKGYTTLQEAVVAAEDGDLIRLFGDIDENGTVTIDKAISIDGNGKALKNAIRVDGTTGTVEIAALEVSVENEYALLVESAATVKVTDSRLSGYGAVKAGAGSVSVKDTDLAAIDNDVISVATDVVVNMNGGSITASKSSDDAKFFIIGGEEGCTGAQLSIMTDNIALGGAVNYVNLDTENNTVKIKNTFKQDLYDKGYAFVEKGIALTVYNAVANVDGKNYTTLGEALDAATDGSTVKLLWADYKAPIAMNGTVCGNKTVTITGTADVDWSKGFFFVGRGATGNGKVIFDGANLTSVSNSSAYGFNVSGSKAGDDKTNDGAIELVNSTIVLDYMLNKGTMSLDNSTLTVKNGFSVTGRKASESATGADATATMTLANSSKVIVNNYNGMGIGHEAFGIMNIDATSTFEGTQNFVVAANGTMNVNGGTVKIANQLTNNGTVYVTGAANLDATVTGAGWFYMNGVNLDADTKLDGAKVAFINGTNNVVGSTIKNGYFSVGVGKNDAAETAAAFAAANSITLGDVTVNVSGNAVISGNGEPYSGWVGSAYSADKNTNKYTLNINSSLATFGYMHVSKDGTLTVDGRSENKYTNDNANVNFYAGELIINGLVTLNNADAWAKFTKMSVDATDGILNINGDTKFESSIHNGGTSSTSLKFWQAGKVNVAKTATVEIDNGTVLVDGAELNIAGNVTAKGTVTGNGTITLTDENAVYTAPADLTVGTNIENKMVLYMEGAYKVYNPAAKIGDVFYLTLQEAIDAAVNGDVITFVNNVTENVTVAQAPDVKITIDGAGKTLAGTITVDGKSATIMTAGLTIKDVNFDATNINKDACINLGVSGNNNTRYICNLTVENCTFTGGNKEKVAIKSYTGGDKNLTVTGCTVDNTMHSLIQAVNITGVVVDDCTVKSKNGINLNSSSNVEIKNSTIEVNGYAVRAGVNNGTSGQIELKNNTLKTDNSEGDAVVVLRGSAVEGVDLTMTGNVVSGATHISGNTAKTKVAADANYWDGNSVPVVAEGSPAIRVNSYYADAEKGNLVRNHFGGSIVGYTTDNRIWGDAWGNAFESYEVKVLDAEGNVMGTTSLQNVDGIIDGDVEVTWGINFVGASNDPYWKWEWTTRPSINKMPAKVQLWIDGVNVGEGPVKLNAPDNLAQIVAATTDTDGNITACYTSLESACAAGENVAILVAGTYNVPTGKDLTITGAVEGVVFDMPKTYNSAIGVNASMTFNKVTFNYGDANYVGLSHAGDMVYNNCTINGQVFLYGQSEIFNNCTFNQESAGAYNVWTYSADHVEFNNCTFNSAGKSVLVYNEGDGATDLVVTETEFNASAAVEGKAAIEIDTSLMPGQTTITIDGETTAEGFANGNVSGNTLWNNKKGDGDNANNNNDITVVVDGVTVLQPTYEAQIGDTKYKYFTDAIKNVKNGEEVVLLVDYNENVYFTQTKDLSFVLNGNGKTMTGSINITARAGKDAPSTLVIKNFNFKTTETSFDFIHSVETNYYPNNITIEGCTFEGPGGDNAVVAVRLKSANNITIKNCTGTGLHSFLQNTAGWNLTIDNVTVNGASEGAFALGTVQGVTVKNSTIEAGRYGIRLDGNYNNNAVIADNKINAFIPVVVRNATVDGNITFEGNNEFTQTNTDGYWCVIGSTEYKENGGLPTAAAGNIEVTLNGSGLDLAGVYGNFGVASIGKATYLTFAAALDAVQNGETIVLTGATGAEKDENGKFVEIEFTKDIEFTITGNAPEYALPIVTLQNATVNIKDATILIPELDARQGAVINVLSSTVHDAGGNGIVKSYYNGAINIDEASTVYTMQVTTMGYINVAGTLNATWQTNVYGNGIITVKDGATFNTAALHLTAQDYNNRDNTDAERVGKPAEILVDGATLNIGKVLSAGGADYSYNSSKGINVGTIDGKSAILDIKNGGAVNIYMANGETANFGAGATVNIDASTLTTACRAAEGTVTLANAGAVNVTGASTLNVKNFTGKAINVTDATLADVQFGGGVNAFGTNNISGTSAIGGILSLGYETNPTKQVVVNITGNFNGTNVIIKTNNGVDNLLNVGTDGERTTAHFGQLAAFADVNIVNADVTYHYAFIRNDLNVTNSALEIKGGVNTYFSGNAKVVIDNSTWNLPGFANIGSYGSTDTAGNADITLKNGSVMTATKIGIDRYADYVVNVTIDETSTFNATELTNQGVMNIAGAVTASTKLTNTGTINFTTLGATLATPTEGVVINHGFDDRYKIVYRDGVYKFGDFVAEINGVYYETIDAALKALTDGATLKFLNHVTVAEAWNCRNDNGAQIFANNVTIDGNGKTLKLTGTVKDNNWNTVFRVEGDNATFKNLTIDASKAADVQRGISAKLSITVDSCKFIGNGTTSRYGVIFGEGAGSAIADVVATVTNSEFVDSSYGVSDNRNGQDVKSVAITGNKFQNSKVLLSASEKVDFNNNVMNGGGVNITSYSNASNVEVNAAGNTLDATQDNRITTNPAKQNVQDGFATPVATSNNVYYLTLPVAIEKAADGATIKLLNSVVGAGAVINKDVTIDFGGWTYSFNEGVGSGDLTSNGFQILKDNTVTLKDGTLNVNADDAAEFYTIIQNYANLTVENMTLDGTYLDKWSATDGDSYVLSNNSGNVLITGNTHIVANDEGDKAFAFDACNYQGYDAPVVTVETTGHIAGLIESTATIVIKNGTYTMDVTEWCDEGLTAEPAEVDGELIYTIVTGTTFIDGQFTSYNNVEDKEVDYIRYERKNMAPVWHPFYLPFQVPVSQLADQGFEVAYINGVRRSDNDEDGKLDDTGFSMELIMIHGGKGNADGRGKTLKANYPYFIRPANGETKDLVIELVDTKLYKAQDFTYDCTTFTEKFEITGTTSNTEIKSTDTEYRYIVTATGWSKRTIPYVVKPFRFYMTVTSRDGNAPLVDTAQMSIVVRGEELPDGTTLIYDIEAETGDEFIFDLTGRRVLETEKGGIYIKNGKKVLVK